MANPATASTDSYNPKRSIFICASEIDSAVTLEVMERLAELEEECDDPIDVVVNTEGAYVYQAFAIYDLLRASKCHIRTFGLGTVMSGGVIIFMAGDDRMMFANARMMMHEASFDHSGMTLTEKEMETEAAETRKLTEQMVQLIANRSQCDVEYVWSLIKGVDFYLGAEEAIEDGFADGIVGSTPFSRSLQG